MKEFLLSSCLVFAVICSNCYSGNDAKAFEPYEDLHDRASNAISNHDLQAAEISLNNALEVAQQKGSTWRVVSTRVDLAQVLFAEKRFADMNKELLTAKDECLSNPDCKAESLGQVYDWLVMLNLFGPKDLNIAQQYVDEVVAHREKLDDKPLADRFFSYAANLDAAGFGDEANQLRQRAKSF